MNDLLLLKTVNNQLNYIITPKSNIKKIRNKTNDSIKHLLYFRIHDEFDLKTHSF